MSGGEEVLLHILNLRIRLTYKSVSRSGRINPDGNNIMSIGSEVGSADKGFGPGTQPSENEKIKHF
jgi:hypothetical protein